MFFATYPPWYFAIFFGDDLFSFVRIDLCRKRGRSYDLGCVEAPIQLKFCVYAMSVFFVHEVVFQYCEQYKGWRRRFDEIPKKKTRRRTFKAGYPFPRIAIFAEHWFAGNCVFEENWVFVHRLIFRQRAFVNIVELVIFLYPLFVNGRWFYTRLHIGLS